MHYQGSIASLYPPFGRTRVFGNPIFIALLYPPFRRALVLGKPYFYRFALSSFYDDFLLTSTSVLFL